MGDSGCPELHVQWRSEFKILNFKAINYLNKIIF